MLLRIGDPASSLCLGGTWGRYIEAVEKRQSRKVNIMPGHDWTRVDAGIFHHFHLEWIGELSKALNRGLLPPDHYALAEQIAAPWEPDVLTLRGPTNGLPPEKNPPAGVLLAKTPPKVQYRFKTEIDRYAGKAKSVVVRHTSGHQIIAVIEIISPGNKSSRLRLGAFIVKAEELLRAGIHLLIVDLFPPGPAIHKESTNSSGTSR
jgi:hypothetical protein